MARRPPSGKTRRSGSSRSTAGPFTRARAAPTKRVGSAVGTKHNLPVIFGTSRLKYLNDFTSHLQSFVDKIRPQLIIVSAGFDTHRLDPIGSLGLEVEDFSTLTRRILEVAATHAAGRVVSVLEGGYNTEVLPLCVAAHLTTLLDG